MPHHTYLIVVDKYLLLNLEWYTPEKILSTEPLKRNKSSSFKFTYDRKFGFTCLVLQPLTKFYTSVKVPLPAKDAPSSNGICFEVRCAELNFIASTVLENVPK